jgi:KaiC/GvpD/RAD55 family RecA-like ATPase
MSVEKKLRTYMSQVFFRSPANPSPENSSANDKYHLYPLLSQKGQKCLVDDLLGGGIVIPRSVIDTINNSPDEKKNPGLFTLLAGPPGSGKSTFALELCYRLADNKNPDLDEIAKEKGLSSIYFSGESATSDIIAQAQSFGWDEDKGKDGRRIIPWSSSITSDEPRVFVYGREKIPSTSGLDPIKFFDKIQENWLDLINIKSDPPRIVVFDSLNILPTRWESELLLEVLVEKCLCGPIMMLAILDSHWESPVYDPWSHIADLTIELSYSKEEDYLVRRMQIIKARYQDHADGEHLLKINTKPSPNEDVRHAMSPLIKDGGIFVFPSVHRALSRARRRSGTRERKLDKPLPTPFSSLNEIIHNGGLPAASCTAIVGSRGGMKSHLAYYTMLRFLEENPDERALLISLRDEEDSAKQTLAEILTNQLSDDGRSWENVGGDLKKARQYLEGYLDDDRLEILFFWPGYISPEEFFHLVEVSLERTPKQKSGKQVSLVVINGLEQLSARFPLCAKEKMFVSGIVTMLTVHGTTNIVVSGGSLSMPPDMGGVPAGLLQMADLVIESSFQLLPKNRVWSEDLWPASKKWRQVLRDKQYERDPGAMQDETHVVYQIIREPGARECRRRALFYMGRTEDHLPLKEGSVTVRLLPDNFPYGSRL